MAPFKEERGGGRTKYGRYDSQFSVAEIQFAVRDWEGNWIVVHAQKGQAYKYVPQESGQVPRVEQDDARAGDRSGPPGVQAAREKQPFLFDEEWQTAKASFPTKSSKEANAGLASHTAGDGECDENDETDKPGFRSTRPSSAKATGQRSTASSNPSVKGSRVAMGRRPQPSRSSSTKPPSTTAQASTKSGCVTTSRDKTTSSDESSEKSTSRRGKARPRTRGRSSSA